MSKEHKSQHSLWHYIKPFVFGGVSGCIATTVIMPIDTWKVLIQVKGEDKGKDKLINTNPKQIAVDLYKSEGVKGFYKGLGAALLRQITYTTARLGLYKALADGIKAKNQRDLRFGEKVGASSISGLVGALVGNPCDVCLIRFQSDSTVPVNERRNYKNVFDALNRIIKEEGVIALWRGSTPTVLRAVSMTVGQLASYDEIKEACMRINLRQKETTADRLVASTGAGAICAVVSLPFDNVKTKLQKMKADQHGLYPYSGVANCFMKTIRREGVTGLWVGLPVFYARVAPHSMILLLVQDALHSLIKH